MHNTGNPIGSKDILDLYDNSEVVDNFVNSQQDETPDRFGTKRLTLAGLIKRSMALRNEINDFSGALTFKPEWTDVPMNVSEGVGGEGGALNLQAEALGNRLDYIKYLFNGITANDLKKYTGNENKLYVYPNQTDTAGAGFYSISEIPESDDNTFFVIVDGLNRKWKRESYISTVYLSWTGLKNGDDATTFLQKIANSGVSKLVIDLSVKVTKEINLTNSQLKLVKTVPGCVITRIGNGSIFVKCGYLSSEKINLTLETTAPLDSLLRVTGDNTDIVNIGDWIFINSNTNSPNVTAGSRTGMLRKVTGKTSNFLQLDMSLSQEVKGSGGVKGNVYKVSLADKVTFEGGVFTSDSVVNNKTPLLHFVLCNTPDLVGVKITNHGGAGASFIHCVGGLYELSETSYLTNNPDNGNFGYGIHLGGATRDYCWNSGTAIKCRHAITTATAVFGTQNQTNSWLPWGESWFSSLAIYGVPESITMGPVACRECTDAAIDTHENAVNIIITPNINGGFDGIHIRGWGVTVDGGQVIGTIRSNIRISSAATLPVTTGWVGEIKIKNVLLKSVSGAGNVEVAAILSRIPGGNIYLDNVTIEEPAGSGLMVLGAETKVLSNNLVITKSGVRGSAPAIVNAGQNSKFFKTLIKNFIIGIEDIGNNNTYNQLETIGVQTRFTGNCNVTRPTLISEMGECKSGRFIVSGGNVVSPLTPTEDNLMYLVPVMVTNSCRITDFLIDVITPGMELIVTRFALYRDNGKFFPGKFVSGGRILTSPVTAGVARIPITSSGDNILEEGLYWIAVVQQGGSNYNVITGCSVSNINFPIGITTPQAAFKGVCGYSKTFVGGITNDDFTGPVKEEFFVPKVLLAIA